jgi:hypothetical protein
MSDFFGKKKSKDTTTTSAQPDKPPILYLKLEKKEASSAYSKGFKFYIIFSN